MLFWKFDIFIGLCSFDIENLAGNVTLFKTLCSTNIPWVCSNYKPWSAAITSLDLQQSQILICSNHNPWSAAITSLDLQQSQALICSNHNPWSAAITTLICSNHRPWSAAITTLDLLLISCLHSCTSKPTKGYSDKQSVASNTHDQSSKVSPNFKVSPLTSGQRLLSCGYQVVVTEFQQRWSKRFFKSYILATSKVILGWALTCDSAHSWWLYSTAPLGNQATDTMNWYPTRSYYPESWTCQSLPYPKNAIHQARKQQVSVSNILLGPWDNISWVPLTWTHFT